MRRSDRSTVTISAKMMTASTTKMMICKIGVKVNSLPVNALANVLISVSAAVEIIPRKMSSEMPLPTP